MPDTAATSHQPPEDRFLAWVDALVDPAERIPVPDADLADLAGTAAFVQRVAGPGTAPSLSTDRTESMWEEIMHTAPTPATLTPTLPASNVERSIAPRTIPSDPAAGWRTWLPTALLIAAIVVAGLATAWRIAGPFDLGLGGNGPETAHQPGVAASATPAASVCNLTNDMPVFVGAAPDAPFLDTYALLGGDGTLALICGETSKVIATDVERVVPTGWPGAIAIGTSDGSVELRNITNGATLQVESESLLDALDSPLGDPSVVAGASHSPWLVSVADVDGTDWRITDLRTMDSMLLSDDFDGEITVPLFPTFQTGFEAFPDRSNGNEIAVVSFQADERPTEADLAAAAPWPGNAVVLPGSLADRRWIDTWPAFGLSLVPSASVSADGTLLAYLSPIDTDDLKIRIETTVDGDLLAEVPIERSADDFSFSTQLVLLAGSEPRLVYSDGTSVELIAWEPEIDRTAITSDELPRAITSLLPTADPDTVVVSGGTQAVTLDLATGEIGETYDYITYPQTLVQFVDGDSHLVNLITFQSESPAGIPATIRVVDPVSGEVLVESEPVDVNPTALAGGNNLNSLARDGTLAVVPIDAGRAIVLDADSGETWEIARPVDAVEQWIFLPSEDGRLIYAISREQYAMDAAAPFYLSAAVPGAEWVEVGVASPNRYIVGTHDLLDDDLDEPAVLEAQDFASPAPDGTSASPGADAVTVWSASSGRGFIRAIAPGSKWTEVTPSNFITFVPGAGGLPADGA